VVIGVVGDIYFLRAIHSKTIETQLSSLYIGCGATIAAKSQPLMSADPFYRYKIEIKVHTAALQIGFHSFLALHTLSAVLLY
jgi:hypothetical protein